MRAREPAERSGTAEEGRGGAGSRAIGHPDPGRARSATRTDSAGRPGQRAHSPRRTVRHSASGPVPRNAAGLLEGRSARAAARRRPPGRRGHHGRHRCRPCGGLAVGSHGRCRWRDRPGPDTGWPPAGRRREPGLCTSRRESQVRDGQAGAMVTPSVPGPACAPITRPTSPTWRWCRPGMRRASRSARSSARARAAKCCTATSTGRSAAVRTARSSSRARARAAVRTFSSGATTPSAMCSRGLIASAEPSRLCGRADPPAAAEVLEGVDVEVAAQPGHGTAGRLGHLRERQPGTGRPRGGEHRETEPHPDRPAVDHLDRQGRVGGGEAGGVDGAGHLARQVDGDHTGGPALGRLGVRPGEPLGRGPEVVTGYHSRSRAAGSAPRCTVVVHRGVARHHL